jgi:hypothetical protein
MAKRAKRDGITIDINIGSFSKSTQKNFNNFIKNEMLGKIADMIMKSIRAKKFIALRPSTIAWRRRIAKTNPTHTRYSPARSNLTLSGEFIDSLSSKINKGRNEVFIGLTGNHPGYFGVNGLPTRSDQPSMSDIAKSQRELGRDLFKVNKSLKSDIIRELRKQFKKRYGN